MVVGYSHSHSLAHVGARLAALGLGRIDARTCATAHEWHLLFGWPDRGGPSRRLFPGALVKNAPAKLHSPGLGSGFTGPWLACALQQSSRPGAASSVRQMLCGGLPSAISHPFSTAWTMATSAVASSRPTACAIICAIRYFIGLLSVTRASAAHSAQARRSAAVLFGIFAIGV